MATKKVTFSFNAPEASSVAIAGDFTSWQNLNLRKRKTGIWSKQIALKPGRYEYKFFINNCDWQTDQNNDHVVENSFGSQNSVIDIQ